MKWLNQISIANLYFGNCYSFGKYFKSCKFEKAVAGGGRNFAGLFEEY